MIVLFMRRVFSVRAERATQAEMKIEQTKVSLVEGGLIAIDIVIMQAFLLIGNTNISAMICIGAFSIAIPLLAACLFTVNTLGTFGYITTSKIYTALELLGTLASFCGIGAAFWHVSWIVGLLFLCSSVLGALLLVLSLTTVNKEENLKRIGDDEKNDLLRRKEQ